MQTHVRKSCGTPAWILAFIFSTLESSLCQRPGAGFNCQTWEASLKHSTEWCSSFPSLTLMLPRFFRRLLLCNIMHECFFSSYHTSCFDVMHSHPALSLARYRARNAMTPVSVTTSKWLLSQFLHLLRHTERESPHTHTHTQNPFRSAWVCGEKGSKLRFIVQQGMCQPEQILFEGEGAVSSESYRWMCRACVRLVWTRRIWSD